ncbi:MAG: hypothetical protein M0Q12_04755 [Synergistaceae bacterium]|nr:hypothetical protein [Synergistaceae bacterium]
MYIIESIYNVGSLLPASLSDIVKRLSSTEMLDRMIPIRHAKTKEDRDKLKRDLPAFTLCEFSERADSKSFISTKYIIYDVDGLSKHNKGEVSVAVWNALDKVNGFSLFSFVSPSGNGIKFVIEMDRDMSLPEYRYNRAYYRNILSSETGLELDSSYSSYHTFFGYHGKTKINNNRHIFTAITPETETKNDDVDASSVASEEIRDIAKYLSGKKLNYFDWTTVCFALHKVEGGMEMFKLITEGDDSEDHAHRDWEKKWRSCGNTRDINVGSLYYVANQHKYERKEKYIAEGRGKFLPFVIKQDGMYSFSKDEDKPSIRVFGFTSIKIQYTVYDPDNGNRICLMVNGSEIVLPSTTLSSASEFRKAILDKAKCNPYMITSGKYTGYYDMLFNYMDKTKDSLMVESLHGIGRIAKDMWNFGSVVIVKGMVLPYDPLLTWEGKGYAIDDVSDKLSIMDNPVLLKKKLNLMHDVYQEYAATAIGWAVANVFYQEIMHELAAFPILFLFGKTASGKTKLATIILAMFGVKNPEKASQFRLSLTSATQTAMARVKHNVNGIPHFFDEYRSSRKDHYEMLKNFYEGAGKAMGKKTNDAQIHRMEISSGSMFASVNKDTEPEAINRCAYIDMNGIKPNAPGAEIKFQREFMSENGLMELSSFAMHIACEKTWQQYIKEYRDLRRYIEEALWADGIIVDSRIQVNYAIIGAGYNLCKGLFDNHVQNDWWVMMARQSSEYAVVNDPVEKFLDYIYGFAYEGKFNSFISMETDNNTDSVVLAFHPGMALTQVRLIEQRMDNLITIDSAELRRRLLDHDDFIKVSTKQYYEGDMIKKISVIKMKYTPK